MNQLPLFGEIPVSQQEIERWLDQIPNLSKNRWRREAYDKAWQVEEKIRALKKSALALAPPGLHDHHDTET